LVEETGIAGENHMHWPAVCHWQTLITQCCIKYTSPQAGFELRTLVVIGTDCIGFCKSSYHTITTTTGLLSFIYVIVTKNKCVHNFQYNERNSQNIDI
jgi:hypothetical protein